VSRSWPSLASPCHTHTGSSLPRTVRGSRIPSEAILRNQLALSCCVLERSSRPSARMHAYYHSRLFAIPLAFRANMAVPCTLGAPRRHVGKSEGKPRAANPTATDDYGPFCYLSQAALAPEQGSLSTSRRSGWVRKRSSTAGLELVLRRLQTFRNSVVPS
jgi:hypothetical protein